MNFCPTCGRQRTGDARFCQGCGTEFRATATAAAGTPLAAEPAAESRPDTADFPQDSVATPSATAPPAAGEASRWDPPDEATRMETTPSDWTAPADATRVERQPDVTRIDARGAAAPPLRPLRGRQRSLTRSRPGSRRIPPRARRHRATIRPGRGSSRPGHSSRPARGRRPTRCTPRPASGPPRTPRRSPRRPPTARSRRGPRSASRPPAAGGRPTSSGWCW